MECTWDSRYQALLVYISCKHCYISSLSPFPFPQLLDVISWRTPNHSPRIHCCKLNYTVIHNAVQLSSMHDPWKLCKRLTNHHKNTHCGLQRHHHHHAAHILLLIGPSWTTAGVLHRCYELGSTRSRQLPRNIHCCVHKSLQSISPLLQQRITSVTGLPPL